MRMFLALGCTVVLACVSVAADYTKDAPYDIRQNIQTQKAILLDVREQDEWNAGHLQMARLMSLSKLKDQKLVMQITMGLPKDKTIYLHCKSGARSMQAAEILEKLGYKVAPIKQSFEDLQKAGFAKNEKK